jgi:alpha-L-glutamate ligase-like protein
MMARLARVRATVLGLNRRNHDYLFRYNPRERYRLVDDKRSTKALLAACGVPTPALHAVVESQRETRGLASRLAVMGDFALKPARGTGGAGIVVVVGVRDGMFIKASGKQVSGAALEAHACDVIAGVYSTGNRDDTLLVEERVVAAPELAALAYRGVPDVRVLVFRGVPVLAMLRLPTRRSDGRANLHLGGVGVGIELEGGRTTWGIMGRRFVEVHPDLGCPLRGVLVPAWSDILRLAVRAASAVGMGFLGVDVVLDARHGPLVLELNARPGLGIQLANRRGLRPILEQVAASEPPAGVDARVARRVARASL